MKSGDGTRADPPQSPERCSTAPHYEQYQPLQGSVVKKLEAVLCVDSLGEETNGWSVSPHNTAKEQICKIPMFFVCLFVLHSKVP